MPPPNPSFRASKIGPLLRGRFGIVYLFMGVFVTISLVMRGILFLKCRTELDALFPLVSSFAMGLIFDLGAAIFASIPLVLLAVLTPRTWFAKTWYRAFLAAVMFLCFGLLIFGATAEWFFWDEFGVRFNFIAVDYLVYTHEVMGNIRESYPMPLILGAIALSSLGLGLLLLKSRLPQSWLESANQPIKSSRWQGLTWISALILASLVLNENTLPEYRNNYNRELAKNGLWSLFAAFRANQLDYEKFYPRLPNNEALSLVQSELSADGTSEKPKNAQDLARHVKAPATNAPQKRLNVIQITVESLSAEFMARFGSTEGITPNLDRLAEKSLVFDRFYATGNRTDRGMEALTLSVPPTPGRSLVKRPHNENLFTLGSVFRKHGYDTAFIYGGYGYFDNMNYFFGENGYRVIDRNSVARGDVSFANVWGACDEDLFRWTLREADQKASEQKPFFFFVMTTSNHRPYTFPEGRIDLPSKTSGRRGAVKYTDYAIGKLIEEASKKPWFKDTVFVIVADHCASSAGSSELPVEKYHIPLIIYAPGGELPTGSVRTLCGQVDYAPTLLGLMNWDYDSRFFGWNVLSPEVERHGGRAFIANYQKLGYLTDTDLSILKPVRKTSFTGISTGNTKKGTVANTANLHEAIAYYEAACWLFKHDKQAALESAEPKTARRTATTGSD